ncbi:MAG TPA: histidine phosphatase family protein [Burkholderiales bacterium]|nr:histidine phosphatase family protein [Burkholderiales bacterium]
MLLIRHGETLWNQQGRMQGQQDSPLTPTGLQQAKQLARRLKAVPFAALYASDLGRAHQTARCIADETGHEVVADERLRERDFGIFEGLTNSEIETRYPDDYKLFAKRDPHYRMEGGESAAEFRARVLDAMNAIAARHAGEKIVVVSHGLVLDALYRTATKMALDVPRGFPLLNCSVNTFRYEGGGWLVVAVCDVEHLGSGDVTRYSDATVQRAAASRG